MVFVLEFSFHLFCLLQVVMKTECQCLLFLRNSQCMYLLFIQLLHKLFKARITHLTFWALCLETDYSICVSSTCVLFSQLWIRYTVTEIPTKSKSWSLQRRLYTEKPHECAGSDWSRPRRCTGHAGHAEPQLCSVAMPGQGCLPQRQAGMKAAAW